MATNRKEALQEVLAELKWELVRMDNVRAQVVSRIADIEKTLKEEFG